MTIFRPGHLPLWGRGELQGFLFLSERLPLFGEGSREGPHDRLPH